MQASAPTGIYTLSLHDALPILWENMHCHHIYRTDAWHIMKSGARWLTAMMLISRQNPVSLLDNAPLARDRKSTRLNSSHVSISYAVFCLKKKRSWLEYES